MDERQDAADADPERTGAYVGHRRAMIMLRRASIAVLPLVLAACDYQQYQSTFGNAAVEARQFNVLFVIFLVICAIMYLLVIGFLLAGIFRSRRADRANVI